MTASLRLTKADRTDILSRALSDVRVQIGKEMKALAVEEREIAKLAHMTVFPKEVRVAIEKLEKLSPGFVRRDVCLRFSFRGMQTTLRTGDNGPGFPVPVNNGYCTILGIINDEELCTRWQAYEADRRGVQKRYYRAKAMLVALLDRCSTLAVLEQAWPEGRLFYGHLEPKPKSALPAIQTDDINAMLGLKKEK